MYVKKNNSKSTVNMGGGLAQAAVSLTVDDGSKFPSTFPFLVTIWNKAAYPDPSDDTGMEIVEVTGRASNVLTIVRAKEGTSDVAHANASAVEMLLTAEIIDEITEESHGAVEANSGTLTPAAYTNRVRVTFVPKHTGEYMVTWYNEFLPINNGQIWMRIRQDTTTLSETNQKQPITIYATDCLSRSGFAVVNLVGGTSYNFDMDWHSGGGNCQIQRSRIRLVRC